MPTSVGWGRIRSKGPPLRCSNLLPVLLLLSWPAVAGHLGVIGQVYPINERDVLEVIMQTLKQKERAGEIKRWQEEGKKRAIESFMNPAPVQGLTRTTNAHSHYWDPTVHATQDVVDPTSGTVLVRKGSSSNPLDYITLTRHMLFLDGTDPEQQRFARKLMGRYKDGLKVVLVNGSPKKLSEKWRHGVYFDQGGTLVARFAIKQVPALVYQEGKRIRIDEMLP